MQLLRCHTARHIFCSNYVSTLCVCIARYLSPTIVNIDSAEGFCITHVTHSPNSLGHRKITAAFASAVFSLSAFIRLLCACEHCGAIEVEGRPKRAGLGVAFVCMNFATLTRASLPTAMVVVRILAWTIAAALSLSLCLFWSLRCEMRCDACVVSDYTALPVTHILTTTTTREAHAVAHLYLRRDCRSRKKTHTHNNTITHGTHNTHSHIDERDPRGGRDIYCCESMPSTPPRPTHNKRLMIYP